MNNRADDDFQPTEADFEMILESVSNTPVKPASLEAGILSMCQRIDELEAAKKRLLSHFDENSTDFHELADTHLKSVNKDLATARKRLDSYQRQLRMQN